MTRDDLVLSAGERLQLRFAWGGDRWMHAIEARDGTRIIWRLESQESGDDPNWPRSPAFQSLQLAPVSHRGNVVLLLGMAGLSHWSASVEADSSREQIAFDVACRISAKPANLGSGYSLQLMEGDNPETTANGPRMEIIASPEFEAGRSIVALSESEIAVRVATDQLSPPQTVRWRYCVTIGGRGT